jgi:hypothetical protein
MSENLRQLEHQTRYEHHKQVQAREVLPKALSLITTVSARVKQRKRTHRPVAMPYNLNRR